MIDNEVRHGTFLSGKLQAQLLANSGKNDRTFKDVRRQLVAELVGVLWEPIEGEIIFSLQAGFVDDGTFVVLENLSELPAEVCDGNPDTLGRTVAQRVPGDTEVLWFLVWVIFRPPLSTVRTKALASLVSRWYLSLKRSVSMF